MALLVFPRGRAPNRAQAGKDAWSNVPNPATATTDHSFRYSSMQQHYGTLIPTLELYIHFIVRQSRDQANLGHSRPILELPAIYRTERGMHDVQASRLYCGVEGGTICFDPDNQTAPKMKKTTEIRL